MHVNISGAGVTAHSKLRTEAISFIEFLSTPEAQAMFAKQGQEFPANPAVAPDALLTPVGHVQDGRPNIAAAGEFQPAATQLADRVGYRQTGPCDPGRDRGVVTAPGLGGPGRWF